MYLKREMKKVLVKRHLAVLLCELVLSGEGEIDVPMVVFTDGEGYRLSARVEAYQYARPVIECKHIESGECLGRYQVYLLSDFNYTILEGGDKLIAYLTEYHHRLHEAYDSLAKEIVHRLLNEIDGEGIVGFIGELILSETWSRGMKLLDDKKQLSELKIDEGVVYHHTKTTVKKYLTLSEKTTINNLRSLYTDIIVKEKCQIVDRLVSVKPNYIVYFDRLLRQYYRTDVFYKALMCEIYRVGEIDALLLGHNTDQLIQRWLVSDQVGEHHCRIGNVIREVIAGSPWLSWLDEWRQKNYPYPFHPIPLKQFGYVYKLAEPKTFSLQNGLTYMIFEGKELIGYYPPFKSAAMRDPLEFAHRRAKLRGNRDERIQKFLTDELEDTFLMSNKSLDKVPKYMRGLLSRSFDLRLLWKYYKAIGGN